MKLAKLVLASSLVASCAFAEGVFVGVVGGYNFQAEVQTKDTDVTIKDKQGFFGLKGGYDFGAYRAYGQYNYNLK
ncbi:MAG: porin family protein, partial [Campylobacter sp.]|nr:porin family protein [Campylobacter sp.]